MRDDSWWGERAKLDQIIYRACRAGLADRRVQQRRARHHRRRPVGARLRARQGHPRRAAYGRPRAPTSATSPSTAPATLLQDARVRQAIQLGINRQAIAQSDLQGLDWPITLLNNHFFMNTQEGYQDNAGDLGAYDPEQGQAAARRGGLEAGRRRTGRRTASRSTCASSSRRACRLSKAEGELAQSMLAQIGVKAHPPGGAQRRLLHQVRHSRQLRHHRRSPTSARPFPVSSSYGDLRQRARTGRRGTPTSAASGPPPDRRGDGPGARQNLDPEQGHAPTPTRPTS